MKKIFAISLLFVCPLLMLRCTKNLVITVPAYAIGSIVYYYNSQNWGGDNSVEYTFIIEGETYSNNYTDANWGAKWAVPAGHYKKGQMFMVEYDAGCVSNGKCDDGQESRILFNYPVKDSTDYKNYVAQFATTPPTP